MQSNEAHTEVDAESPSSGLADGVRRPNAPPQRAPDYGAALCQFDSWVWVQLTQARKDPEHPLAETWTRLCAASDDGRIQVALISGNYLELWNRSSAASRRDVARTMAKLTGYATLRAVHQVLDEEVRRLVDARRVHGMRKVPNAISREWLLGSGASHAFGSPEGRIRFVSHLRTLTEEEGGPVETPAEWLEWRQRLSPNEFEWINLAGFGDGNRTAGIEYRPSHRDGDDWTEDQQKVRELVAYIGSDQSLLYRMLVFRRLSATFDQATTISGTDPEVASWFTGPIAGAAFIGALPSQQVYLELLFAAHRDLNYAFRQHDRIDLIDLSLSIPYCDVVIPDAHWAHLANATRLAREYGTNVLQGRNALKRWAETL